MTLAGPRVMVENTPLVVVAPVRMISKPLSEGDWQLTWMPVARAFTPPPRVTVALAGGRLAVGSGATDGLGELTAGGLEGAGGNELRALGATDGVALQATSRIATTPSAVERSRSPGTMEPSLPTRVARVEEVAAGCGTERFSAD